MVSARSQAASCASGPCGLVRRMMPRQERKHCSALSVNACIHLPGHRWLRSRRITSISVAVWGPIFPAQVLSRSGDHSEWCRSPLSLGPMARHGSPGRQVIRDRHVLAIARGSDMGGDASTLVEYLDRPCGKPDPDLLAQQAVRGRVVMLVDLDVPVFN